MKKQDNLVILNVIEPYLGFIKSGKKIIEGRLCKDKYSKLMTGDRIKINELDVFITDITKYESFEKMLIMEGIKNVLPDILNLNDAIEIYRNFYTQNEEANFGVLAIRIKVINE